MTTDDLTGKPHLVILQSETALKVITFTGLDADEKAHAFAMRCAQDDFPGCITVAVRVRQLCAFGNKQLMT